MDTEAKLEEEIAAIKSRIEDRQTALKKSLADADAVSAATTELRGLHVRLAELERRRVPA